MIWWAYERNKILLSCPRGQTSVFMKEQNTANGVSADQASSWSMIVMGLTRRDDQMSLVVTNTLVYMLALMSDGVCNCKSQIWVSESTPFLEESDWSQVCGTARCFRASAKMNGDKVGGHHRTVKCEWWNQWTAAAGKVPHGLMIRTSR